MGNFQVYDAFSILFQFEKPHVEHLEGFIFLSKKSGKLNFFFKTINWKFQFKNSKEFPH